MCFCGIPLDACPYEHPSTKEPVPTENVFLLIFCMALLKECTKPEEFDKLFKSIKEQMGI